MMHRRLSPVPFPRRVALPSQMLAGTISREVVLSSPNARCSIALLAQVAGAPGSLSIKYLPLATDMIGTPGTLRILRLRSRSLAGDLVSYRTKGGMLGGMRGRTADNVDTVFLDAVDNALEFVS